MFEENKEVVRCWLRLMSGDRSAFSENRQVIDPAMCWTLIGSTGLSGTFNGVEEIEGVFQHRCWNGDGRGSGVQGLDPVYGIKPLDIREIVAIEDGRVMVHCFSDGRGRNGVAYRNEYCWLITVREGQIVSLYEFADTALIERAIFDKKLVPAELP